MHPGQPGDLLARRYRLQHVIGQGGMGVVWLAADELLRRDVAIKEATRPPGLHEQDWQILRQRSLYEARAAARVHHPNIASVYDVIGHDDRPWIVMQLVPHPSLREVLRSSGPLSSGHAAQMGWCVLAGMRAAFAAGVLHRDIKPANILLGPDGSVVLTDFGLAAADAGAQLTLTGTVVGSPAYMSPERARGEQATLASDLWSLGATLYAAVEGRDPFARSSTMAVLTAVVHEEPDPPELCGPLWPVISALLRKDPRARLGPEDAERRLASAASLMSEPAVTGPVTAAEAGARALAETPRGRGRVPGLIPAAVAVDGAGGAVTVDSPPDNPGRRLSRAATGAWLVSGLAAVVLFAAILLAVSLSNGSGPGAPANSPRLGSKPVAQAHPSRSSMQPLQTARRRQSGPSARRTGPAVVRPSAQPKPAPPAAHVPPGQAKKNHRGHKPK
jgi:tRNA A-37 threonylcarbamoyl transferase component Bud32